MRTARSDDPGALAPFRVKAFRWFWIAAVGSNGGTWMQTLAIPIAVYQATGKATWIGITAMAGLVPSLVANSFAGSIADRFERRKVLFLSQFLLALTAVAMWAIFRAAKPSMPLLCVVIACSSMISGVSITTWQSFVPSLVPRTLLAAAVRLNSLQFALGRALGPLLAAVTISRYGTGIAFIANAVSYVAVLAVLAVVPRSPVVGRDGPQPSAWRQVTDGWRYVAASRSLMLPPLFNLIAAMFGFAFVQLAAPIAEQLFDRPRSTSTWLNVGFGIGGIVGMAAAAAIGDRVPRSRAIPGWLALWSAGLALVAFAPSFRVAVACMSIVGFAQVTVTSNLNTALQVQVADAYRGRAIGVYMYGIMAGVPIGSLGFGAVIDRFGARPALLIGAGALLTAALLSPRTGLRFMDEPEPSGPGLPFVRPRIAA